MLNLQEITVYTLNLGGHRLKSKQFFFSWTITPIDFLGQIYDANHRDICTDEYHKQLMYFHSQT